MFIYLSFHSSFELVYRSICLILSSKRFDSSALFSFNLFFRLFFNEASLAWDVGVWVGLCLGFCLGLGLFGYGFGDIRLCMGGQEGRNQGWKERRREGGKDGWTGGRNQRMFIASLLGVTHIVCCTWWDWCRGVRYHYSVSQSVNQPINGSYYHHQYLLQCVHSFIHSFFQSTCPSSPSSPTAPSTLPRHPHTPQDHTPWDTSSTHRPSQQHARAALR